MTVNALIMLYSRKFKTLLIAIQTYTTVKPRLNKEESLKDIVVRDLSGSPSVILSREQTHVRSILLAAL